MDSVVSESTSITDSTEQSLSSFDSSALPMKCGWLKKKSPSVWRRWQNRYFVLYNKRLYYYASDDCERLKGVINFDQVSVDIQLRPADKPTKLTLRPLGHKRVFHMASADPATLTDWAVAVHAHVSVSQGKAKDIIRPSLEGRFWRRDYISDETFRKVACTGDLLLFRSHSLAGSLLRCATGSAYDHVALVLRYSLDEIAILEATSQDGVAIVRYDDFFYHGWLRLYKRITLRHLELPRTDEFMQNMKNFIENSLGKSYKLNPKKLLRTVDPGTEEDFFCSELVAAAYKKLGLLPAELPARSLWPKDFAEGSRLVLLQGSLSPEMPVDYSLTH